MTKPCAFGLGLGVGAWSVVASMHLAAKFAHRHFLEITTKEKQ